MIDCTSMVSAEIETKQLRLIELSAICYENQTKQHDRLYRCGQHQKRNWVIITNQTRCGLWWKTKEQWHDWSIGVVYVENEIELSWPIEPSVVYEKNQTRQQRDR